MKLNIRRDSDPFKKYWWVVLLVFVALGAWICYPSLESSGISGGAPLLEQSLKTVNQSLDAVDNPNGAPGSATDLAMDQNGPYRKQSSTAQDSLYQAPPEAASQANSQPPSNLADALKNIALQHKSAASAGYVGNEHIAVSFRPPQLGGAAAGAPGESATGGSSASSYSSGGSESGRSGRGGSAFGESQAQTKLVSTQGLPQSGPVSTGGGTLGVLHAAAAGAVAALHQVSNDAAASGGATSFDGNRLGTAIGGGGAASADGIGGVYSSNAKPMDLKPNDPHLDFKNVQPPAAAPAQSQQNMQQQMMQMLMMGLPMMLMGAIMK